MLHMIFSSLSTLVVVEDDFFSLNTYTVSSYMIPNQSKALSQTFNLTFTLIKLQLAGGQVYFRRRFYLHRYMQHSL